MLFLLPEMYFILRNLTISLNNLNFEEGLLDESPFPKLFSLY